MGLKKLVKKAGRALKKVGNFAGDAVKGSAKVAIAPIESITGRDWNPNYRTKAGRVLAVGADKGMNQLHIVGKSFADGISGGNATKLANKFRKKEYRETAFNYNEHKTSGGHNSFGVKNLDKGFNKLSKFSTSIGALYGSQYALPVGGGDSEKSLVTEAPLSPDSAPSGNGSGIGIAAGIAAIVLGVKAF